MIAGGLIASSTVDVIRYSRIDGRFLSSPLKRMRAVISPSLRRAESVYRWSRHCIPC